MNLIGALIGALVGGFIGGAIWVAVGYGTGYEVGWIAWGIGLLAGLGAAFGSKRTAGAAGGILAVAVAIITILVSKYLVIQMVLDKQLREDVQLAKSEFPGTTEREFWVSYTAHRLIEQRESAGQSVNWPAGVNPDEAYLEADYPADVWHDAASRWDGLSPDAKSQYCEQAKASIMGDFDQAVGLARSELQKESFLQSFSLFDLLWAFLAIGTAFKVGSGQEGA